jgi:hypothetical protein
VAEKSGEAFQVNLARHEFSGSHIGICDLKANGAGRVKKFACGGFTALRSDGRIISSLESPADAVVNQTYNVIGRRIAHRIPPASSKCLKATKHEVIKTGSRPTADSGHGRAQAVDKFAPFTFMLPEFCNVFGGRVQPVLVCRKTNTGHCGH